MLDIVQIPIMEDNYVYLIHEPNENLTAVVDPGLSAPVLAELDKRGWKLTHILNTHHHWDHTDGNLEVQEATGCQIIGPKADRERIPGIQTELSDGDRFQFGTATAHIFDVPGHTKGHIAYWFGADDALFCGDTLFSLGCGRMFEGTPKQFWTSLQKLRDLPDSTRIYCAHEYTQANAAFARDLDPENPDLKAYSDEIDDLRAKDIPTIPAVLGREKQANPFLRADIASMAANLGMTGADPVDIFAEIRRRKDHF